MKELSGRTRQEEQEEFEKEEMVRRLEKVFRSKRSIVLALPALACNSKAKKIQEESDSREPRAVSVLSSMFCSSMRRFEVHGRCVV